MATIDKSYVLVLGPVKMEVLNISDITSADTIDSQIQAPEFGAFVQTESGGVTVVSTVVGVSGREITLTNTNFSASAGILFLFGF